MWEVYECEEKLIKTTEELEGDDRLRVYNGFEIHDYWVNDCFFKTNLELMEVPYGDFKQTVHVKQCRKLIKK